MNDNGIYRFFRQSGMIFALASCSQVNKSDEKTHTPVIKYAKEDTRRSAVPSSVTDNTSIKHPATPTQNAGMNIRGEAQARVGALGRQSVSSGLNLLVPLQENENRMLFGQLGGHHHKNKNTVSVGVGQRHFGDDWGLGYNVFYDAQMSKSVYHRLGVGGELWFDNARFTANGYYGLTHNRDVDERPGYYAAVAHGYDVNLQAWIPGYRQLSGRVKFEQYFGDRVAFTKKGQEARNPYALSLGLSYAPIPLLQFDVDRVLGGQKQTENRFGVSVRYQFGVPLSLQLDPTYNASQYLNKAKKYHVVDRNSAIVLSFREKPSQRIEKPLIEQPVASKPPAAPPKKTPETIPKRPEVTPKQPAVPPTETPEVTPKRPEVAPKQPAVPPTETPEIAPKRPAVPPTETPEVTPKRPEVAPKQPAVPPTETPDVIPKRPEVAPKQPAVPPTETPEVTPKRPEVTPRQPAVPPTETPEVTPKRPEVAPKQPAVPPTTTPRVPTLDDEWGTPPLDTDETDDDDDGYGTKEKLDPRQVNVSDKDFPPYHPECNLHTDHGCEGHPKRDVDVFVFPASPDGKPLKELPAKQESHAVIDETGSPEGFVIVEPSATKRGTPDEQDGFEFVRGS